ncbi:MAG TPA: hypothetical protein VFS00_35085, partial [Polyangiaceae bacterium]|nr:hypothetical protein [Polyangiaceae bacterium]
ARARCTIFGHRYRPTSGIHSMTTEDLKATIDSAWEQRDGLSTTTSGAVRDAVEAAEGVVLFLVRALGVLLPLGVFLGLPIGLLVRRALRRQRAARAAAAAARQPGGMGPPGGMGAL